tara:strand:- start:1 stop:198 length:198 start_codon:yes stop_codon:yes gene_type:complete
MINIFRNIIFNRPNKNVNMLLGRWNLKNNQDIGGTLANMDSCGDRLCGDINVVKKAIQKYVKKKN